MAGGGIKFQHNIHIDTTKSMIYCIYWYSLIDSNSYLGNACLLKFLICGSFLKAYFLLPYIPDGESYYIRGRFKCNNTLWWVKLTIPNGERWNYFLFSFPGFNFEDITFTSSLGQVYLFFGAFEPLQMPKYSLMGKIDNFQRRKMKQFSFYPFQGLLLRTFTSSLGQVYLFFGAIWAASDAKKLFGTASEKKRYHLGICPKWEPLVFWVILAYIF